MTFFLENPKKRRGNASDIAPAVFAGASTRFYRTNTSEMANAPDAIARAAVGRQGQAHLRSGHSEGPASNRPSHSLPMPARPVAVVPTIQSFPGASRTHSAPAASSNAGEQRDAKNTTDPVGDSWDGYNWGTYGQAHAKSQGSVRPQVHRWYLR